MPVSANQKQALNPWVYPASYHVGGTVFPKYWDTFDAEKSAVSGVLSYRSSSNVYCQRNSRKMMQAERGVKRHHQHGHPIELELARRKWTACTEPPQRKIGGKRAKLWLITCQVMHNIICKANKMHAKMSSCHFGS